MTKCPPGLAIGINRFTAPRCCQAIPEARRDYRERRFIESVNQESAQ